MFLNTAKFKAIMKKAYKEEKLTLYRINEKDLEIFCGDCIIVVNKNKLSPKEKAAVIEFAGEFPGVGECFTCTEHGNQMEIVETKSTIEELMEMATKEEWKETYILCDTNHGYVRAFQNKLTNEVRWYQERLVSAMSSKAVDSEHGETLPEGPVMSANSIIYQNNTSKYVIFRNDLRNETLDSLLANMELYGTGTNKV